VLSKDRVKAAARKDGRHGRGEEKKFFRGQKKKREAGETFCVNGPRLHREADDV